MLKKPAFFLPETPSEKADEIYSVLARMCDASVPALEKRIYSITFTHNSVEWTATVGDTLKGVSRKIVGKGKNKTERELSHSDPATVMAIFAGTPYRVMTNGFQTKWAVPFLAGEPKSVAYFLPSDSSNKRGN